MFCFFPMRIAIPLVRSSTELIVPHGSIHSRRSVHVFSLSPSLFSFFLPLYFASPTRTNERFVAKNLTTLISHVSSALSFLIIFSTRSLSLFNFTSKLIMYYLRTDNFQCTCLRILFLQWRKLLVCSCPHAQDMVAVFFGVDHLVSSFLPPTAALPRAWFRHFHR